MKFFDQIFILLSENNSITLNFDILETGLLNIIVLVVIVSYLGINFFKVELPERKKAILTSIIDAEDRLNEAKKRLNEAQKELTQAKLLINEMKNQTLETKKTLLKCEVSESKEELISCFNKALVNFNTKQRQIFLEVKQQIIFLALKRTIIKVKETFGSKRHAQKLVTKTIKELKGGLV